VRKKREKVKKWVRVRQVLRDAEFVREKKKEWGEAEESCRKLEAFVCHC